MGRFIVIEGLIGVGKTSLCRVLEREWSARLILEPCDDNPFLAAFYADSERFAFPAQMFYLAARYSQQMTLQQTDLFRDLIVSDYLFEKDRLFAEQTLEGHELDLYDRFSGLLGESMPAPEFVLFLDAPTSVILERIAQRAINAEQVIEPAYLDSLRDRYYALWERYEAAPVYVLDTANIDYIHGLEGKQHMLRLIEGWLTQRPCEDAPAAYHSNEAARQITLFPGHRAFA